MSRKMHHTATMGAVLALVLLAGCRDSAENKTAQPPEGGSKTAAAQPSESELAVQAELTARTFFEACAKGDWESAKAVAPFYFSKPEWSSAIEVRYGGLEIIELGKAVKDTFKDGENKGKTYPGFYVPYKIKTKAGQEKQHRIAIRNDGPSMKWRVDGGI